MFVATIKNFKLILFMMATLKFYVCSADISDCYRRVIKNVPEGDIWLEDVLTGERQPRDENTIFFHITNCFNNSYVTLTSRQACAVESAAINNPYMDVFVLFASPAMISKNKSSAIASLLSYGNIFFRVNNLWKYTEGTPTEKWFKTEVIFKSMYLYSHLSDLCRYVTLWRFGGIYLDADVVVIKTFQDVPLNFAGAESNRVVASGVMGFEKYGLGYRVSGECLKKFIEQYNGNAWGSNGPMIITNVLKQSICHRATADFMTRANCKGFKVYSREYFYAINYNVIRYFFEEKYLDQCISRTNNSILIHVWNKLTSSIPMKVGARTCYGMYPNNFAQKFTHLLERIFKRPNVN